VTIKVSNVGGQAEDYTVEQDGTPTVADRIGSGASRTTKITLKENQSASVTVMWRDQTLKSATRKADCTKSAPQENLPHTGPDSAATYAKVATGVAAMITGGIIFWYGGIWPRRRDQVRLR
jgi:hypothetical protein